MHKGVVVGLFILWMCVLAFWSGSVLSVQRVSLFVCLFCLLQGCDKKKNEIQAGVSKREVEMQRVRVNESE